MTGETFFFVDKCLPFGCAISCAIFQDISDAIAHIVRCRNRGKLNVNYLDDFLFAAVNRRLCNLEINNFLQVCEKEICFPVVIEKTYWATTLLSSLGLLLDTVNRVICIPIDKLEKTLSWIEFFLNKTNKKATVLQFQKLTGTLNFLCKCIIPGRAFLRRLYLPELTGLKPHHHVKISAENQVDLLMWKMFLSSPNSYY